MDLPVLSSATGFATAATETVRHETRVELEHISEYQE
jgi:hypothetical protein